MTGSRARATSASGHRGTRSASTRLPACSALFRVRIIEPRYRLRLQLVPCLAGHLLDKPPAHLFAHGLEFLVLLRIDERLELLVKGDADRPQALDLLECAERRVLLQRLQLLQ